MAADTFSGAGDGSTSSSKRPAIGNPQVEETKAFRALVLFNFSIGYFFVIACWMGYYIYIRRFVPINLCIFAAILVFCACVCSKNSYLGYYDCAANALTFGWFVATFYAALNLQCGRSQQLIYIILLPFISSMLQGVRSALMWFLVSVAMLGLLFTPPVASLICRNPGDTPAHPSIFFALLTASAVSLVFGVVTNVATRMQRDKRKEVQDQRDQAIESRMRFVSCISHDLRTPLHGILGTVSAFDERLDELCSSSSEEVRAEALLDLKDSIRELTTCTNVMLSNIDNVLDISRLSHGDAGTPTAYCLGDVMDSVMTSVEHVRSIKFPRLVVDQEVCGPPCTRVARGLGHPSKITQILQNLISNAMDASPASGGRVTLRAAVASTPQEMRAHAHASVIDGASLINDANARMVVFCIEDQGHGIPLHMKSTIFDPYVQGNRRVQKGQGTGLGLHICSLMTTQMGGVLDFASSDRGTSFYLICPFEEIGDVEEDAMACAKTSSPSSSFWSNEMGDCPAQDSDDGDGCDDVACAGHGGKDVCDSSALPLANEGCESGDCALPSSLHQYCPKPTRSSSSDSSSSLWCFGEASDSMVGNDATYDGGRGAATTTTTTAHPHRCTTTRRMQKKSEDGAGDVFSQLVADRLSQLRVLVAEDEAINTKVMKRALKKAIGSLAAVDFCEDGESAVRMATNHVYDVILMDGRMPRLDGNEATRAIRAMETRQARTMAGDRATIIAVTSLQFPEDRDAALECGADDLLLKPFSPERLRAMLVDWTCNAVQRIKKVRSDQSLASDGRPWSRVREEMGMLVRRRRSTSKPLPMIDAAAPL